MTNEEIIEAKNNEIIRLHRVCINKNEAIQKAINFLNSLNLNKTMDFANELKEHLG